MLRRVLLDDPVDNPSFVLASSDTTLGDNLGDRSTKSSLTVVPFVWLVEANRSPGGLLVVKSDEFLEVFLVTTFGAFSVTLLLCSGVSFGDALRGDIV